MKTGSVQIKRLISNTASPAARTALHKLFSLYEMQKDEAQPALLVQELVPGNVTDL